MDNNERTLSDLLGELDKIIKEKDATIKRQQEEIADLSRKLELARRLIGSGAVE